ncbi:MAG TPA: Xaa-Pro aminopeptidase [Verrucomicrobiota bacterium]|nr:Xaa-Pro aminopeptidase [Verrucomicrobiota bacterium]HNT16137.1 Xaa-Pro aminopeptidase [Verrucomicrobiota bacterium]
MKTIPLPAQLFVRNRERLLNALAPHSVAVLNANDVMPTNADGTMGFQQNADLFYLTGINQEETRLVLAPDAFDPAQREILFLRQPSEHLSIWEGHKLDPAEAAKISGIKNVKWLSDFPAIFRQLACAADVLYLNTNEHQRADNPVVSRDARFVRECQRQFPLHRYERLARLMHTLRAVKSDYEIAAIQAACHLTGRGFKRVCRFVRPGVNEAEIEAEFAHEFIRHKGQFAYPPIIASGANNNILHYVQNDQICRKGELLLLDVAAGLGNYMSDLTRTIPVSGRFTRRQKQVYAAVLRVFRAMVRAIVPGKTTRDLRAECEALIARECVDLGLIRASQLRKTGSVGAAVRPYFMHGVSHPIGLDVHDATYNHLQIAPGWVLSCEPGIYLKDEGFGIRLENTILVTETGQRDLMADVPIEAGEIEALMRH